MSQDKLIKQGLKYTDSLFLEIENRLKKGVLTSDTLESFLIKTKDYTILNPLVMSGFKDNLLSLILTETNNHKFTRPAQKELTRVVIENSVGEKITGAGDDLKNNIREIVKQGYNNNLPQDEIADNIVKQVRTIKNTRARTIARTEIARTATISDYIINKERGATHFTVDCRETCCKVCRSDYNFGKVEYDINKDVSMLPPRHPNCRCVANFYKKDDAPESFKSRADLEKLKSLEGWKSLNENNIPDHIPTALKDNMISFEKQSNKFDDGNEWAQVCNLTTAEIYEIMSNGESDNVSPFKDKDYGDDEVAVVHNHQDGTFLSPKDFYSGFYNKHNIKYVVVHTDNYIFIAKLINLPTESEFKQFVVEYNNIRASSSPNECWNMFNSNPITKKYISVDMVVKK